MQVYTLNEEHVLDMRKFYYIILIYMSNQAFLKNSKWSLSRRSWRLFLTKRHPAAAGYIDSDRSEATASRTSPKVPVGNSLGRNYEL